MMSLIAKILLCIKVIRFLWSYRSIIFQFAKDTDNLVVLVSRLVKARVEGVAGLELAQDSLIELLDLEAIPLLIGATETKVDDEWLAKLRSFAHNDKLFKVAWLIVCGKSASEENSTYDLVITKIKNCLPWSKTETVESGSVNSLVGAETVLEAGDIEGVGEIINAITLCCALCRVVNQSK